VSSERAAFAPLVGALFGALGGAAYWLAAQIWPASVAVILSMALTAWLVSRTPYSPAAAGFEFGGRFFCLFVKYSALMALSAAKLPFAAPANVPLGIIMVCAHAASFALVVSATGLRRAKEDAKLGSAAIIVALLLGLAPAAILGIPGLSGLVAAIAVVSGVIALRKTGLTQLLSETGFYLGALATWRYV
jgi:adenosylcobinamide-GDP ribazoletransferase